MAEIATFILEVCKCLCGPASDVYSDTANYEENFTNLRERAQTLRTRLTDVEQSTRAARSRGELIRTEVEDWIGRASNLSTEVDALNIKAGLNGKICGRFPNYCRQAQLSKGALQLYTKIMEVLAEPRFDIVYQRRPSRPAAPAFRRSLVDEFKTFSATKVALDKVMKTLRDIGVDVIGVHGTGGVGKTTLVKEAAALALEQGMFDRVAFVTVSNNPDMVKLQSRIAETLGVTLGANLSHETRAGLIKERIMEEKRVLVVLDDIWKTLNPEVVGLPCGTELTDCESKILFTTRIGNLVHRMGCRPEGKISLDLLSETDSWKFFKRTAGTNFRTPRFKGTAKLVAKECGGLPLALVAIAKALGDKTENEWDSALDRLKDSMPPNSDDDRIIFYRLKLSFEFLEPVEKACFLLCCLFPEDHNILKEDLARYLFGLGLFPKFTRTLQIARGNTETITNKLISSGLLLQGDKSEQVKMHDVFRDVAIQLTSSSFDRNNNGVHGWAEEQVFMVQAGNTTIRRWPLELENTHKDYTAISTMSNDILELVDSPDCEKLQTLMLQENNNLEEIPAMFFKNMAALRLLDVSGTKASLLPLSTNCLKMLRTLYLDRSKFGNVSRVGELEKLLILSLKQSIIDELPKEIGMLSNLRLLDLTLSFKIKRIKPNIFPRLRNLEELYLKGSFSHWHDGVDPKTSQNARFSELVNLPRLTVLCVDIDYARCLPQGVDEVPNWGRFNISLCGVEKGRFFGVHSEESGESLTNMILDTPMRNLPDWFNDAASGKAEKLVYSGCETEALDLVEDLEHGRLSGVKSLVIEYCNVENYLIRPVDFTSPNSIPVFEALQKLQIYETEMEGICSGDLPPGSFVNLTFLEVQQCVDLDKSLMTSNLIKRTSNLKKLRATGSPVSEIFEFNNLEEGLYLGSLREIRLENLYDLMAMWKGPARFADFTKLRLVSVIKCEKLKTLLSVSVCKGLSQLEDLWVEDCMVIEDVIRNEDGAKLEKIELPKLKTLSLLALPKLNNFYASYFECPSLEYVHVQKCPSFRYSISEFHSSETVYENDEQHLKNLRKRSGTLDNDEVEGQKNN